MHMPQYNELPRAWASTENCECCKPSYV